MIKRLLIAVILLGLVFGGIFGWKLYQSRQQAAMMAQPQPPATVAAAEVRTETWRPRLTSVGTVEAIHGIFVTNEVAGKVSEILFESGEEVSADQALLQLDDSVDQAELRGLIAERDLAAIEYRRLSELLRENSISRSDVDQAKARLDNASAQVASKRALIAKKRITAPFAGRLGIRRVDLGEFLTPGSPMVPLQALDPVYVDFSLPERDFSRLEVGRAVEVRVTARPDRVFEGRITAVNPGVEQSTRTVRVRARNEVLVCASALNSPKLLMLSGIGPADHLQEHGIEVVHDLPGVGENLQDHLEVWVQRRCTQRITLNGWLNPLGQAWIGARWLLLKSGLGASNQFESNGYIRSREGLRFPDLQYHFLAGAIAYDGSSAVKGHGFQVHLGANKPDSRGRMRLRSADPEAPPSLRFNYLAEESDRQAYRDGLRLTRELFAQPAFDPYRGEEVSPGEGVQSDDEIDDWVARTAETAYHPCGSCRMGTDDMAVVDPECRVYGVEGLRVVDSSVMPTLTNGNINAPTIMIGEKAADHILGRQPLAPAEAPIHVPEDGGSRQREDEPVRRPADLG